MSKLWAFFLMFCTVFWFLLCFSDAIDTLAPGETLAYNETLVSDNGVFNLGFFGSDESGNHYLGIWLRHETYKKVVWVANRDNPFLGSSGVLTIRSDGNLVITDSRLAPIIVNSGRLSTSGYTSAKLLDTGNLVLEEMGIVIWQSFDYPTDTFLPGMKLGWFNIDTSYPRNQFLVSWLSPEVPTSGPFYLGLNSNNKTQLSIWRRDAAVQNIGSWDGHSFRFFYQSPFGQNFNFVASSREIFLTFNNGGEHISSWFVLASTGDISEFSWTEHGISVVNHSICDAITGINSTVCLTSMPSMCKDGDRFTEIRGSIPNSAIVSASVRLGLNDCEIMCRSNCSCIAFASFRRDGTGCQLYYGRKRDFLRVIGKGNNQIYIRGGIPRKAGGRLRKLLVIIIVPIFLLTLLFLIYLRWGNWTSCNCREANASAGNVREYAELSVSGSTATTDTISTADVQEFHGNKDHELPLLSFSSIISATDNFSSANKLGEGGYGPVYKGALNGYEIAVKRLCNKSGQGLEEFKNEVRLISKLQHRNLVKLVGFCVQQEERILVYEYMPNRSLDSFIFDLKKREILDWRRRMQIIEGVAQGLLYLHKYSRLRIIHRDLKTSNILLDDHMNPRISDFGMARIFSDEESHAKTKRIAGTYGYMAPEYAAYGLFSTKSDVFSFGVIVLETVSGRKNATFCESNCSWNLIGHAWNLWKAGRYEELMDSSLANSCAANELKLCIQLGLLCVQEQAEDRPTMSDVISMLSNERATLPLPKQPAFSTHLKVIEDDSSTRKLNYSLNTVPLSPLEGR